MRKRRWNNLYMLRTAVGSSPLFVIWTVASGLMNGCICAATEVIFLRILFNRIGAQAPFQEIVSLVLKMGLFYILFYLLRELGEKLIAPLAKQDLHRNLQRKLFEKAQELDLARYDDPNFYHDFVWAMQEADERVVAVLKSAAHTVETVSSTALLTGILLQIDPILVLLILVTLPAVLWSKSKVVDERMKRVREQRPFEREQDYIDRVFRLPEYGMDIKLSDVDEVLIDQYQQSGEAWRKVVRHRGKRMAMFYSLQRIAGDLMNYAGVMLVLCYKTLVSKTLLLGDFAAAVNGFWRVSVQLCDLIECSAEFREHSLYIEKFRKFLETQPDICDRDTAVKAESMEGIRFDHVSYAYPGSENYVLRDVTLEIKPHQKIALVGVNGAGKTTLIKLLCRLYDPTEGRVLLNGMDIRDYTLASYRSLFSAMFQDYYVFAASLCENVAAGIYHGADADRVSRALEDSGFSEKLSSLPHGADSQLTREFDKEGVLLSGGETQKLVVARTLAKPCQVIIFDEASSALDPFAEYELNQAMLRSAEDKSVIFISHRLATAKLVDRIYLLDQGRIAEQGSHAELMDLNGQYAEMFKMQAENYN